MPASDGEAGAATVSDPQAGPVEDGPRWFRAALAQQPEHREIEVDGHPIHLRCWGEPGAPVLVLVHGGAAHSGWWDHIAPFFAGTHRVVAPDLSGHGDSARRATYGLPTWAREVVAAGEAAGAGGRPVVVGHSLGGWVAGVAGIEHGAQLDGIVIIDSPLHPVPPEEVRLRSRRPLRTYADREEIIERFATVPPQEVLLPYVRRHVAEESIRRTEGGWTWKFDPQLFGERMPLRDLLPDLKCRAAYLRSEFGLVPPEMVAEIGGLLGAGAPVAELPDAGHHPMLDQPLALVAALRMLLAQWTPGH